MRRALLLTIVPVVAVMAAARAQQPPTPRPPLTLPARKPSDPCAGLQQLMQEESNDREALARQMTGAALSDGPHIA
jgi:hypothetical protein